MAAHTTIGCGGPVDFLVEAFSTPLLSDILTVANNHDLPWIIVGQGSNLLVADTGWRGLAIFLADELDGYEFNGNDIICGGGMLLPRAARLAAERGLSGLEPLAGIPGTIGGAIVMNAGAFGATIGELVSQVETCDHTGCRSLEQAEIKFGYRGTGLPAGSVVTQAVLSLKPRDPVVIEELMRSFRARREAVQPRGRSFGSMFRNPPGDKSAGELLDQAGCKGMVQGNAEVSRRHANFIINRGSAKCADILHLMNDCRRRVFEHSGVVLQPEVRLLGDIQLEPLP
jgi:UDP-N-acetylmuramate dehydrogenase